PTGRDKPAPGAARGTGRQTGESPEGATSTPEMVAVISPRWGFRSRAASIPRPTAWALISRPVGAKRITRTVNLLGMGFQPPRNRSENSRRLEAAATEASRIRIGDAPQVDGQIHFQRQQPLPDRP